jgi:hypothetical protein
MKIVHIAPNAPYNDGWGYQENLLPKHQKKMGHDVTLIITDTMHKDGKIIKTEEADYYNSDGVRIIRKSKKKYLASCLNNINSKIEIYDLLKAISPDFVFYHGLVSSTILDVVKYKKKINRECVIVQDNHLDNFNSGKRSKIGKIVRSFYRHIAKKTLPYISKVYGVTPLRKKYAKEYFNIPDSKLDILIMGADDDKINFADRESIRRDIRRKYGISNDDFLIVTGGKIDKQKKIDILMDVCKKHRDVKLLIFGSVLLDVKNKFEELIESSDNIIFIGWLNGDAVYDYFLAADLVCFPGSHSVLWEQACACKVPCLFSKMEGMEHVNNGGNSIIIETTTESLEHSIGNLVNNKDLYNKMLSIARSSNTDIYLYSNIAQKSLECCINK